jgi:sensor histidine kinase YesM
MSFYLVTKSNLTAKSWLRDLRWLMLINLLIALLLFLLNEDTNFIDPLIYAYVIGTTIWLLAKLLQTLAAQWLSPWLIQFTAVMLGLWLGFVQVGMLGLPTPQLSWSALTGQNWQQLSQSIDWRSILVIFLICGAAAGFFLLRYQSLHYRTALEQEKRRLAELQQAETLAQLKLLQAQIEPHFLFNTLANVQGLMSRDPALAKHMLEQLNTYLRASLQRTRRQFVTVADELELVEALIGIAQIRLGHRFHFRLEIPDELTHLSLPPLLLQPLVENALRHGIEPMLAGGELHISGWQQEGMFHLQVKDNGSGIAASPRSPNPTAGHGVGLINVRQRLFQLYGPAGRLELMTGVSGGFTAELQLPLLPMQKTISTTAQRVQQP